MKIFQKKPANKNLKQLTKNELQVVLGGESFAVISEHVAVVIDKVEYNPLTDNHATPVWNTPIYLLK